MKFCTGIDHPGVNSNLKRDLHKIKSYFSLNDFHAWPAFKEQIQRNNYHHRNGGPSLTGITSSSVSLIFTHGKHWNVKYR